MAALIQIPQDTHMEPFVDSSDLELKFRQASRSPLPVSLSVLRVVVMAYQSVIEDQIFSRDSNIYVGNAKGNTFCIPTQHLPKKHRLLAYHADGRLTLALPDKAYGAICIDGQLKEVQKISGDHKRGINTIELKRASRGFIEFGNVVVFFEEIAQPPAALPFSLKQQLRDPYFVKWLVISLATHLLFLLLLLVLPKPEPSKQIEKTHDKFKAIVVEAKNIKEYRPAIIRGDDVLRGKVGLEGEGERAPGPEGRRGRGVPGRPGEKSKIDVAQTGVLTFFSKGANQGVLSDLIGGGSTIADSASRLGSADARYGLPGERELRSGKGLTGTGSGGGNPNTASIGQGLGTKGKGGGQKDLGGLADFGTSRGDVSVSASIDDEEVFIQGNIPKSEIARIIQNHLGQIKSCYDKELQRQPGLRGKVVIDFIIGLQGSVTSTRIKETTMNNTDVEGCIERVVRRMPFPSPGGGVVQVIYPFIFSVAG